MNNTNKYILELETKLQSYQKKEKEWEKEQTASITIFKDKEKEIKQLNQDLNQAQKVITNLEKQIEQEEDLDRERDKEWKKDKEKIKELEQDNSKLYETLKEYHQEQEKSNKEVQEQLKSEKEKNRILEEKLLEAENQAKEGNLPSPIEEWEQEKEELIKTFEKTRNEQGKEITELEKENNQLDQDLNKAVDLLESKDKEIENLKLGWNKLEQKEKEYKENISKLTEEKAIMNKTMEELKNQGKTTTKDKETTIKTFFCDGCQLTKQGNYIKRKVDSPFEPRTHGRTCYLCSSCSPYYKELSEPNYDKDNNPYKY